MKLFQNAINMLKEMGEVQALTNLQQAKKTRSILRELQEELITKTVTGGMTDKLAEENKKRRKNIDEDKDIKK
eukprot:656700-Heterocapsa_arctica.AAC.1